MKWFRRSAELGFAAAKFDLGRFLITVKDKNIPEAITWLTKAAEQGLPIAHSFLSYLYYSGTMIPYDTEKAIKWSTITAEKDEIPGCIRLGDIYMQGKGTALDDKKSFKWFLKAAELGSPTGQFIVACCYYLGDRCKGRQARSIQLIPQSKPNRVIKPQ